MAHQSIPLFLFLFLPRAAGCGRGLGMHLVQYLRLTFLNSRVQTRYAFLISQNWFCHTFRQIVYFCDGSSLSLFGLSFVVCSLFLLLSHYTVQKKGWPLLSSNILHPYIYPVGGGENRGTFFAPPLLLRRRGRQKGEKRGKLESGKRNNVSLSSLLTCWRAQGVTIQPWGV